MRTSTPTASGTRAKAPRRRGRDLTPDRTGIEAAQAVTGADGAFDLEGLRPAGHAHRRAAGGCIFSCPLEGLAFGTLGEQSLVCAWQTLTDRTDKAIGAVKPGSISGVIWLDENEDGTRGEGRIACVRREP